VAIIMYVYDKLKLRTAFLPADVATVEPLPDVAQDRRPTVRTNSLPQGSPVPHDLKTSGSSDYAYTYAGMGLCGGCSRLGTGYYLFRAYCCCSVFVLEFTAKPSRLVQR
jgi:hypothetical protein